jgi:hypothetical protein
MKHMKKFIAIALLSLTSIAPAQKTDGILVEIDASRSGNESSAIGRLGGTNLYFVLEVTEVATKKTFVIACQRTETDCGIGSVNGQMPNHARYLMKYIQSAYPDNAKLFPNDNSRYPLFAGRGVEMTGAVQVLDESVELPTWVKMTGKMTVSHFFILKQKQTRKVCPPAVLKATSEGKCTLARIRLGLQSEESCRCELIDTPEPLPMERMACEACDMSPPSPYPSPSDPSTYTIPAPDPVTYTVPYLRTMIVTSITKVGVPAEIKGDAIILHNKLASPARLKDAVDAMPVPFAQPIAGAASFLNLLQKAQIREYVLTNDAGYTGHYDMASGKITE